MPLTSGTRLGPYEILSPLGAGGMGEVSRAKDTRLEREMAVKVLPAALASNPDFKQRFEREAKTISSLNHAAICALYDVGLEPGDALMLYTDGVTEATNPEGAEYGKERLAEALRAGQGIPVAEAAARLEADLTAFVAGVPFGDDRTLLILRRERE